MLTQNFVRLSWLTVLVVAVIVSIPHPGTAQLPRTQFVSELVDPGTLAGWTAAALDLDGQGNPHIAYRNTFNNKPVKYATRSGGSWSIETIDATAGGPYLGMGVDGQGRVHVAYFDDTGSDLKYALRAAGGGWTKEFVDTVGNVGYGVSLVVDDQGDPHICYLNRTTNIAKYATKSGADWTTENTFGIGFGVEGVTSIALDGLGNPHITYFETFLFDGLVYSARQGGIWLTPVTVASITLGVGNSLGIDAMGFPHVAYSDTASHSLYYATTWSGTWTNTIVEGFSQGAPPPSLTIDTKGIVHIAYESANDERLRYARVYEGPFGLPKSDLETVDVSGTWPSIALNYQNLPAISYMDGNAGTSNYGLKFADAAVHLDAPNGGETWPVGSTQAVTWRGAGPVDILLSVDGGNSYDVLKSSATDPTGDLTGGSIELIVPHRPSRFCMVKVQRDTLFSTAVSDSFFTIETSISLLSFVVTLGDQHGAAVSWNTDPGPADLGGYRLDKRTHGGLWFTLVSFTTQTSYSDADGSPGDRYRLYAMNGLGEEFYMGETGPPPRLPEKLSLWPVPYRSGDLHVSFATASGLGGGKAHADVAVYDVRGRFVKQIVSGQYPAGVHTAVWDGRNARGQRLATGVYFVRATSGGEQLTQKLVIVR